MLRMLITAGPTREPLDPVRYLSNRSSGKMGYALAEAARALGHRVTLISGPVSLESPSGIRRLLVETAAQMQRAVQKESRSADVIIMAAAVVDYAPATKAVQKIKKGKSSLTLRLKRTPDILAELGKRKKSSQCLIGFAAETTDLEAHARRKLRSKNLDFIVANRVGKKGTGFESDHNEALLLARDGARVHFPRMTKQRLARLLMRHFLKS